MTIIQAMILGLVQGLTEFLPVSSSGHLVIFQTLLGFETPPILFDVLVHLATLTAVIIYFWKRLIKLSQIEIKLMIVGTIPAVIAGFVLEPFLEEIFSSLYIVSAGLMITATMLWVSHRCTKGTVVLGKISINKALLIGLFQAMAIIPGVSRSGSTVSAGLSSDLKKEDAFFFSFLLAIPAILGAGVLQLKDIQSFSQVVSVQNLVGFLVAAVSGVLALKLLNIVISKAKLHYFAIYCLLLSIGIIIYQLIQ